jgi:hypothetical protein
MVFFVERDFVDLGGVVGAIFWVPDLCFIFPRSLPEPTMLGAILKEGRETHE